jgi:Polysaccharide biosynthesis
MGATSRHVSVPRARGASEIIEITQTGGVEQASEESEVSRVFRRHYSDDTQMSAPQIEAIAAAIKSRGPHCNMLVFGLGNDSPLWAALNSNGYTLFLEDVEEWITKIVGIYPTLNVRRVSYAGTTVASASENPGQTIKTANAPLFLLERRWDVIVIDGPMGYAPQLPGRALPICWVSQICRRSTHIFVDDYERKLEQAYSDFLFKDRSSSRVVMHRPATSKVHASSMLWLIGCSDPLLTN